MLERAAEAAVLTIRWLDEDGNELNETQQIKLVSTLMRCFDGTEQEIRSELERNTDDARRVAGGRRRRRGCLGTGTAS